MARFSAALDPSKKIGQYVFNSWGLEQGLPQDSVQAIWQTRDGYLWMGTQAGVVRFNGVQFKVFDKSNTSAFKHNDVRSLFEDREGRLWMGTAGGGVVEYHEGKFLSYTTDDGLSDNFINTIFQDREGNVWLGGNLGLNRLKDGKFEQFGKREGLSARIASLAQDPNGDLWVGTANGLYKFSHGIFRPDGVPKPLTGAAIEALYAGGQGGVWVGTNANGIYWLNGGHALHYGMKEGLPDSAIQAILQDKAGTIWVGAGGGGICRLRRGDRQFECYG